MNRRLPTLVWVLSLAGLIPFLGCGFAAITDAPAAAALWLMALLAYGAIILSFLGGVHWGIALDQAAPLSGSGGRVERARLILGVLPPLLGWAALLLPLVVPAEWGLLLLIIAFAATAGIEGQGHREKLVPAGYMALRWALSAVVIAVLAAVLVVRLLGARVAI